MNSFLFIGIVSAQVSLARVGLATCTADGDCPSSYVCSENTCKKCLRCDLIFRKGNFCVFDFNDCKDCLEGYEELLVTSFSNVIKPCKPIRKKVKLKTCQNDSSCPQDNYCKEDSCVKCFDCSLLNRVPPVEKCAKGLNECGSCMIGYSEVSVTTEANYKPCEKDTLIVPELSESFEISLSTITPICVVTVVLFIMLIILVSKLSKAKTTYQRPIRPSAPPLQLVTTPQCVRKIHEFQPTVVRYTEEKKQQAKVFKYPTAEYYYKGNNSVNQPPDLSQENNGATPPESCTPTSNRTPAEEELNCSPRLVNENSEVAVNYLEVNLVPEQPESDISEQNDSPNLNIIPIDVVDVGQILEDASDEDIENLPEVQTLKEEEP